MPVRDLRLSTRRRTGTMFNDKKELESAHRYASNADVYDAIADEYYDPQAHKTTRNFDQTTSVALQNKFPLVDSDGLVLDVGCGRGRIVEYLRFESSRVVQLDGSAKMLALTPRETSVIRVHHR